MDKQQLVVHWDGKIMADTTNKADPKSKVDGLAVVVTGRELEKILGIVKLPSGTGTAQTSATHQLLELWSVTSDVVAMCFDTTSTNTGTVKGARSLLEFHLNKNLIYLLCRHHNHELIVGGVFSALFGPSHSPNIAMFERFQQYWPNIDRENYASLSDPRLADPLLQELKSSTVSFLKSVLAGRTDYMPRDDYKLQTFK